MSAGDFTQPVPIMRSDELGDLQRTVDQMRKSLADTTVNRNYLDNVLNSMADAVFVVRPDGTIRFTNLAAQRLTGADAEALNGRHVARLLEGSEAGDDARLARACEVGEAVLRTESGQTIPVSFTRFGHRDCRSAVLRPYLCGARHHRPQARRAAHPLPGAL